MYPLPSGAEVKNECSCLYLQSHIGLGGLRRKSSAVAWVPRAVGFSSAARRRARRSCEILVMRQRTKLSSLLLGGDDLFKY